MLKKIGRFFGDRRPETGNRRKKQTHGFVWVFILWAVLLTWPDNALSFSAKAQVDKTQISKHDTIHLQVIVENGEGKLDLSSIKDFQVHSRGRSSSYQIINGQASHETTHQFVLIPLYTGELTIPPIVVKNKNKKLLTNPITISVFEQLVSQDDKKDLFATASVNRSDLYVGQQAVYTIKFFTSKRLAGLGFESRPEFNELSSKPFEKEKNYTINLSGVAYNVTQVDYLIIPSTSGEIKLDPVVFVATVIVRSGRDPMFDSFFSSTRQKPVRIVSNPVTLNVKQLPPYTGAGDFSGLVGRFEIKGDLDQTNIKAGDSATYTLKISGSGNIMDAGLPKMDLDRHGFKVYDDNPVDQFSLTEKGYTGTKTFKRAIVPVKPGTFKIDPALLVYFDVDKNTYVEKSTQSLSLDVLPSDQVQTVLMDKGSGVNKNRVKTDVSLENTDILEIKEGLFVLKDYKPMSTWMFAALIGFPALVFLVGSLLMTQQKKEVSNKKQMKEKAKEFLKKASNAGMGDTAFLGYLYAALMTAILAMGNRKSESISLDEATSILEEKDLDEGQVRDVISAFKTIESVRFGTDKIDENKAGELFSTIKKLVKMLCVVAVLTTIFSIAPQITMASVTSEFTKGVEHYKFKEYKKAALAWESVANTPVRNPHLYFNIGNAYLRANDIGRAILWYERAKILDPGDPDLNFNLSHANTLVKDKKQEALDLFEILFFWDSFVGEKVVQITAICFSILFFGWGLFKRYQRNRIFSGTGVLLCALFLFFAVVAVAYKYQHSIQNKAVIVADTVSVRSGTSSEATKLFTLHAGSLVNIEQEMGTHFKIIFSKEMVGWVEKDQAIPIYHLSGD